jgi:hypothetical protein
VELSCIWLYWEYTATGNGSALLYKLGVHCYSNWEYFAIETERTLL